MKRTPTPSRSGRTSKTCLACPTRRCRWCSRSRGPTTKRRTSTSRRECFMSYNRELSGRTASMLTCFMTETVEDPQTLLSRRRGGPHVRTNTACCCCRFPNVAPFVHRYIGAPCAVRWLRPPPCKVRSKLPICCRPIPEPTTGILYLM